jgi:DNA-binding NtrC family response regulator
MPAETRKKMGTPKPFKILVVDDEEVVRCTVEMFLDFLGHSAVCVKDGQAGISELQKNDYDTAIVDIRMPGISGLDFLARAKEIRPEIPVILISGHGGDQTRVEAREGGAFAFLAKPFRLEAIRQIIENIRTSREAGSEKGPYQMPS